MKFLKRFWILLHILSQDNETELVVMINAIKYRNEISTANPTSKGRFAGQVMIALSDCLRPARLDTQIPWKLKNWIRSHVNFFNVVWPYSFNEMRIDIQLTDLKQNIFQINILNLMWLSFPLAGVWINFWLKLYL